MKHSGVAASVATATRVKGSKPFTVDRRVERENAPNVLMLEGGVAGAETQVGLAGEPRQRTSQIKWR
jgi:hypothetical protein